jgi:hypothetical protein
MAAHSPASINGNMKIMGMSKIHGHEDATDKLGYLVGKHHQ